MVGDEEWANDALREQLGSVWDADDWGHNLLHMGWYDPDISHDLRMNVRGTEDEPGLFDKYLEMFYDVELDEVFDWDAWREWYDAQ